MSECIVGVIGGSGLLESALVRDAAWDEEIVETEFGAIRLRRGQLSSKVRLVFVQRHGCEVGRSYAPPHLIPYQAVMRAFQKVGCKCVVGFCSAGSLKTHIPIGSIVVPDDFFSPASIMSVHEDKRSHTIPGFSERLRSEVLTALFNGGLRPYDGGVYINSRGPRFETKAEIRFMAAYGDVIGMTGAHEATLAKELGIHYAMVCTIDNMANGIGEKLSMEEFYRMQQKNRPKAELGVHLILNHFKSYPEILPALHEAQGAEQSSGDPKKTVTQLEEADLIVHARYVVTVDASDTVLDDHAIVVTGGKIVEIIPSAEADHRYGVFQTSTMQIVRFPDGCIMPGLVNAHTHSPMTFLRGYGDDMAVDTWLTTRIWPAEVRTVSAEFAKEGARLSCAEFIKGGTTLFSDMYFFPEAVAEAVEECGMRAVVGAIMIEFPSNYASGPEEYMCRGLQLVERYKDGGPSGRVACAVSPHSPYTVSEPHLKELAARAATFGIPFHIHVHESTREVNDSENGVRTSQFCHMSSRNCRPLQNLLDLGIVNERFVAAHMVHLTDEEIAAVAARGASVVHCPTSNLKLASGFCQVSKLISAGVNVALGTDGAASNNSLDMFAEMKLSAILAKGVSGNPESIPAATAIRMATINGARAFGLGDLVGSLEKGKQADFIAVDLTDICTMPTYSILSHLVYATTRMQVSDVWVSGVRLLRSGQLTTIDALKVRIDADKWRASISALDVQDGKYK